jgi:hypothetical protein
MENFESQCYNASQAEFGHIGSEYFTNTNFRMCDEAGYRQDFQDMQQGALIGTIGDNQLYEPEDLPPRQPTVQDTACVPCFGEYTPPGLPPNDWDVYQDGGLAPNNQGFGFEVADHSWLSTAGPYDKGRRIESPDRRGGPGESFCLGTRPPPTPPLKAQGRSSESLLGHSVTAVTNIRMIGHPSGPDELEKIPWTYALDVWPAEDHTGEFHSFNYRRRHITRHQVPIGVTVICWPVHSLLGFGPCIRLCAVQPHCPILKLGFVWRSTLDDKAVLWRAASSNHQYFVCSQIPIQAANFCLRRQARVTY